MIIYNHYNIRNIENVGSFERQINQDIPGQKVIIRTCQRLEVYHGNGCAAEETVHHLFKLVCGLDSVFIGDTAIKGQVKNAYRQAAEQGNLTAGMHRLFQTALKAGKLVQSNTGISTGAVSYPQAVIRLLQSRYVDFTDLHITIAGINDISMKLIRWFINTGAFRISLVNRTYDKLAKLEIPDQIGRFTMEALPGIIKKSDILILCTSSPGYLVTGSEVSGDKELCIIDLSYPRNADPSVSAMNQVHLVTLDEIEHGIGQNLEKRKAAISMAMEFIQEEVKKFMTWQNARKRSPDSAFILKTFSLNA